MASQLNSTRHSKNSSQIICKLSKRKIKLKGKLPNSLSKAGIHHLITKLNKETTTKATSAGYSYNLLNKVIPADQVQEYIKRSIHHDEVILISQMQGSFNIDHSISVRRANKISQEMCYLNRFLKVM